MDPICKHHILFMYTLKRQIYLPEHQSEIHEAHQQNILQVRRRKQRLAQCQQILELSSQRGAALRVVRDLSIRGAQHGSAGLGFGSEGRGGRGRAAVGRGAIFLLPAAA